jgi:catechol 2,3-dioxygenase
MSQFQMPSTARLGYVQLTVANLENQIMFYTQALGFTLHWRNGAEAALGTANEVLLRLSEVPQARRNQRTTGMYHFAILYPSIKELARAVARLFAIRYPNSPTDHGMSKTTYLDDLEGNTIELYVRSLDDAVYETINGELVVRYADGCVGNGRDPLDLDALFSHLSEQDRLDLPLPEGTQLGHMHLYARDVVASNEFYTNTMGFQLGDYLPSFRMSDVGLDAEQPHVVAFNNWKGPNLAAPAPERELGMRHFSIVLPNANVLNELVSSLQAKGIATTPHAEGVMISDPSELAILLTDTMLPVVQ